MHRSLASEVPIVGASMKPGVTILTHLRCPAESLLAQIFAIIATELLVRWQAESPREKLGES
jgi:hypothetical protein